jgi:hypothetical protein
MANQTFRYNDNREIDRYYLIMVSSHIQATEAQTRAIQNLFFCEEENFPKKQQGLELIVPGPVCFFCTTPVARRTEYLLHKKGHEILRYAHCNDPLDTAANLRRKSSKDLLLCVFKS